MNLELSQFVNDLFSKEWQKIMIFYQIGQKLKVFAHFMLGKGLFTRINAYQMLFKCLPRLFFVQRTDSSAFLMHMLHKTAQEMRYYVQNLQKCSNMLNTGPTGAMRHLKMRWHMIFDPLIVFPTPILV